ncbi:MAG: molecular chaperone HtpG [Candidatus Schekmanbacteria bacterium]|nr:molecular chaperone HtpG [Candidatus Schekmanbacteria bacterium]
MSEQRTEEQAAETFTFQAEVSEVLNIVVNSLYSHPEIFLRELISNASDALDKLKFSALTAPDLLKDDVPLEIRIIPDRPAKTLTIEDTGIGMTHDQLVKELGTIAHSGTRAFLEEMKRRDTASTATLIGKFGVGFYSAFLVADQVEVISLPAIGADRAFRWTSSAGSDFSLAPASRPVRGTAVILHLKEDKQEFLDEWKLRELVTRYSDFVNHPIMLQVKERPSGEGGKKKEERLKLEQVNRGAALWQRSKSEIKDEEYDEFFMHIAHDYEPPLARAHFKAEGRQEFTALLYIPKRAPFDLFLPDYRGGVRLYVRRIFIMEDCRELLPTWLRFVRGVIDSSDLPLNVSREILQDSSVTKTIQKQVTRKVLDLLESLAKDEPEKYETFWKTFGGVLKEGMHFGVDYRERLAKLGRWESSAVPGLTSLTSYVERMQKDQEAIYYILGDSRTAVEASPHTEVLRQRNLEVLYMTDMVDEFAVEGIRELDGKPLVSAMRADLKLAAEPRGEDQEKQREKLSELKDLRERFAEVLGERVKEVRFSQRLTDSPACLVIPEGGMHAQMERVYRAAQRHVEGSTRIFEINPDHPVVANMKALHDRDRRSAKVTDWIELLYEQALLTEGSSVTDPNTFARRLTRLLEDASTAFIREASA